MRTLSRRSLIVMSLTFIGAPSSRAQAPERRPHGWEFVGLPALNFDSDEGVGYGALLEIYNYGSIGVQPYRYTIQPTVFLTTKGRRDVVVFFDAPSLLPFGLRLDAFVGREEQIATPYYGIGNETRFEEALENPPDAYFYRYGRTRVRVLANVQHKFTNLPARVLFGGGFARVKTDATPFDSGTTLLATQLGATMAPRGTLAYVRTGLVWDTRNREIAPSHGTYGDILLQRVDEALGSSSSYTRVTGAVRKYWPLTSRLVFAQRLLAQQTSGDVPLYDLATIQTSYKQQEGLGGTNTVRGLPKNRFVGKGIEVLNTELRWRFRDFRLLRKDAYLTLSGFYDVGRVWTESIRLTEIASDLHDGYGGGIRLGLGPSFAVAVDAGRSSEWNGTQIYIGLGYPF